MAHSQIAVTPVFAQAPALVATPKFALPRMVAFTLLAIAALPLLPLLGLVVALTEGTQRA
jgi:hypothetical protein